MSLSLRTETPASSYSRRNAGWSPETSPTWSEESESDQMDFESDLHPAPTPTSPSSTSGSMSAPLSNAQASSSASASSAGPSRFASITPSSMSPTPSGSSHPYRGHSQTSRPASRTPSVSPPKVNLPKSQPLSRALFARMAMAEIPHAGMSNSANGGGMRKVPGKQKMIVATKPMRTTFELGLTSSELARRA